MTLLRFSHSDYQALARVCQRQDVGRMPLPAFKKLLVLGLAQHHPALAQRLVDLCRDELTLLQGHFREHPSAGGHGLTPAQVEEVAHAARNLFFQVRFLTAMQRALVRYFTPRNASLAAALGVLTLTQFEALCTEVREQPRKDA